MARALAFGLVTAAALLWLTFFAGPGSVDVATLAVAVAALIWFVTVHPARLVDAESGRPQPLLFVLSGVGLAILVTGAVLISSATTFLLLAVGLGGIVAGLTRAIRYGFPPRPRGG